MARIAVDLDRTCHAGDWSTKWNDPIPGAKEALTQLRSLGHTITIHTARTMVDERGNPNHMYYEVVGWLTKWEIPFDSVWIGFGKPQVDVFIDDRAVTFEGDWAATLSQVLAKTTL